MIEQNVVNVRKHPVVICHICLLIWVWMETEVFMHKIIAKMFFVYEQCFLYMKPEEKCLCFKTSNLQQ